MKPDEDLCRQALNSLLQAYGAEGEWSNGSEPPDWFLKVNGRRFAVEATSIHGLTTIGGRTDNWTKLSNELIAFGEDVCNEIEKLVNVPGCFFVSFPAMPNLKSWRPEIVRAITRYLETYNTDEEPLKSAVVLRPERREVTIRRIGEGQALVAQALPTGAFITRHEDQLELLLATEIRKKVYKLRNVTEPIILVILDRYGFQSSTNAWQASMPPENSQFEAVVRVHGGRAELVTGTLPVSKAKI